MEKEFVPYELAVKLKALGFDEPCLAYFDAEKVFKFPGTTMCNRNFLDLLTVTAPLYQQAFRWFREKYNLHSFIDCKWKNLGWEFQLVDLSKMETISSIDRYNYKTYEEAELACLTKLIEIVEQKEK
jgi:hypothetical protein